MAGMFARATALAVDEDQRRALEALARAGTTPQRVARKCEVILLASQGVSNLAIARQLSLSRPTVIATRGAFARAGVDALRQPQTRQRSRRVLTPAVEQQILDTTLKTRPPDATHWSARALARRVGVSRMMVQRVRKTPSVTVVVFRCCSASSCFRSPTPQSMTGIRWALA